MGGCLSPFCLAGKGVEKMFRGKELMEKVWFLCARKGVLFLEIPFSHIFFLPFVRFAYFFLSLLSLYGPTFGILLAQ